MCNKINNEVTNEVVVNTFDDHFSDLKDLIKLLAKHAKLVSSIFGHERSEILFSNILTTIAENINDTMGIFSNSVIFNDGWYKLCTVSYYIDMAINSSIDDDEVADRLMLVFGYDLELIERIPDEEEREAELKNYIESKELCAKIIKIGRTEEDEDHIVELIIEALKKPFAESYNTDNDLIFYLDKMNGFEFACLEKLSRQKEGVLLLLSILSDARRFRTDSEDEEFKKADKEAAEKRDAKFYQLRKEADELKFKLTNSSK